MILTFKEVPYKDVVKDGYFVSFVKLMFVLNNNIVKAMSMIAPMYLFYHFGLFAIKRWHEHQMSVS